MPKTQRKVEPSADPLAALVGRVADLERAFLLHVALAEDEFDGERPAAEAQFAELLARMGSRLALMHGRRK